MLPVYLCPESNQKNGGFQMSKHLLKVYEELILHYPVVSILAIVLITVVMAFGLPNLKLDASLDSLTLENDKDLAYYRESIQRYGNSDFLVVTYKPRMGDLFDDSNLSTLEEICMALRGVEGIEKVISMLDVPLLYSPKVNVLDLQKTPRTLLQPDVDRSMARQEFLESPVYSDLLVSEDAQTTIILAEISLDEKFQSLVRQRDSLRIKRDTEGLAPEEIIELRIVSQEFRNYRTLRAIEEQKRVAEIREKMAPFKNRAEIFLGGLSMITADMVDFIKSDLIVFGAVIVLFIVLTLAVIFRQSRWVFLPLVTCILSVGIILGYLGWTDWRMTVVSSNFVSLLLIITLALTIHLVVRYRELLRQYPDKEQLELVRETVSSMARPCFYTMLTTVVAFSSLVFSDLRPVIDFGWMMTFGLVLSLIVVFVLIPAGLMVLGKTSSNDTSDSSASFSLCFSRFTENYGGLVLGVSLLAGVASIWGVSRLQVENHFIDYFHEDTEIYQGLSLIDNELGGTVPLDIILDAPPAANDDLPGAGGLFDGDDLYDDGEGIEFIEESYWLTRPGLEEIERLHNYLDSLIEVGKVSSLVMATDVYSDLVNREISDLELGIMPLAMSQENAKFLLLPYLNERENQARISLRIKDSLGELNRSELLEEIHQFVIDDMGYTEQRVHFTGPMVLYNNMLQSLFQSQIMSMGTVFVCIMAMFLALFRSLSVALIAIIPNLLAAGIVLGCMGMAGIPLDMMTITIAAITVGIGVDHDIHYITRFKREFAIDNDYIASMHRAHGSIGRALFYTAITIIVGFSVLTLSNFMPSVYFGLFTGLAMLAALFASMTLLPKLILVLKPFKSDIQAEPKLAW